MGECKRCGKKNVDVHTCTPKAEYYEKLHEKMVQCSHIAATECIKVIYHVFPDLVRARYDANGDRVDANESGFTLCQRLRDVLYIELLKCNADGIQAAKCANDPNGEQS